MILKNVTVLTLFSLSIVASGFVPFRGPPERVLDFNVNGTLMKNTKLIPIMKTALALKQSVGVEVKCSNPATIALKKCGTFLLHSANAISTGVIFSEDWLRELSTPTMKKCGKVFVKISTDKNAKCVMKVWIGKPFEYSKKVPPETSSRSNSDQVESKTTSTTELLKKPVNSHFSNDKCRFPDQNEAGGGPVSKLTCDPVEEESTDNIVSTNAEMMREQKNFSSTSDTVPMKSIIVGVAACLLVVGLGFKIVKSHVNNSQNYTRSKDERNSYINFDNISLFSDENVLPL